MPTIPQLPETTIINADDELPLSQAGLTRSVSVGNLLANTQPAIGIATGSLLGRVSTGAGAPEPVGVGTGLAVNGSALTATGADHAFFPVSPGLGNGDQVVVSSNGRPALLAASALRALFTGGENVGIDVNGVISSSMSPATTTQAGAVLPGAGLSLGPGGSVAVAFGTGPGMAMQGNDSRVGGAEQVMQKGQPGGYAALDAFGRVPTEQLPAGVAGGLVFHGLWNAASNTPALASGSGAKGEFWQVSAPGNTNLDGNSDWSVGDVATFNGTVWERLAGGGQVTSVAGRSGSVTLTAADIGGLGSIAGQPADAVTITGGRIVADLSTATSIADGSAAARTLSARFADLVNINDFGLARDGVTDDSPRVVAAIAAAVAKAGRLYVPAGGPILLGGAAQITLGNVSIFGDGLPDLGSNGYGHLGSQFWIADTVYPAFRLRSNVTLEGLTFYYPAQYDQPNAPLKYPPLFANSTDSGEVSLVNITNCQVTNCYDFLTVDQNVVCGDVYITDCRICAINTCMTLPNVPEVIYLTNNLFSFGVFENEYNHWSTGGTHAQTTYLATTAAAADAGATVLTLTSTANLGPGMLVRGQAAIPYNAVVTAVSGSTVTISPGLNAGLPADASISFVLDTFYLRSYTATQGTWLLITGNGTPQSVSTISHGGVIATNNYVFGFRYGIHIDGGNLLIARLTNTGFDQVGTILQCDNSGTVVDLQIDNFIAYGLLAVGGQSPATSLFVISDPPPDASGNPTARLSISGMTLGFSTGTVFDISGANVAELKVTDCKITRFGNSPFGQPFYGLRLNAPNARLLFANNDVLPAGGGNTGLRLEAASAANITGNMFTGLQLPVDVQTTGGMLVLSGNVSTGTTGASAIGGIGTGNVQDWGNGWDRRPLGWNPIIPTYRAAAVNGVQLLAGGSGAGASVIAAGGDPNVILYLGASGTYPVVFLTRQYLPQLTVYDVGGATDAIAIGGGTAASPPTVTVQGSDADVGLIVQGKGTGAVQLGSIGGAGSPVVLLGALADRSYSLQSPADGASITVPGNAGMLQLTPPGPLASLGVTTPAAPVDGQILVIASTQPIGSLTLSPNAGQTLNGAPSSLAANAAVEFRYMGSTWYRKQ